MRIEKEINTSTRGRAFRRTHGKMFGVCSVRPSHGGFELGATISRAAFASATNIEITRMHVDKVARRKSSY